VPILFEGNLSLYQPKVGSSCVRRTVSNGVRVYLRLTPQGQRAALAVFCKQVHLNIGGTDVQGASREFLNQQLCANRKAHLTPQEANSRREVESLRSFSSKKSKNTVDRFMRDPVTEPAGDPHHRRFTGLGRACRNRRLAGPHQTQAGVPRGPGKRAYESPNRPAFASCMGTVRRLLPDRLGSPGGCSQLVIAADRVRKATHQLHGQGLSAGRAGG
jgi:hypothetical protein